MNILKKGNILKHLAEGKSLYFCKYLSISVWIPISFENWKIRLIEGNAKCRHQKNRPVKGLCGRCLSFWRPEPHPTPPCILLYSILMHPSKGGELNQRGNSSQSWVKIPTWLMYLQSINSFKHLPQSPSTGQVFKKTAFCYIVNWSMDKNICTTFV